MVLVSTGLWRKAASAVRPRQTRTLKRWRRLENTSRFRAAL